MKLATVMFHDIEGIHLVVHLKSNYILEPCSIMYSISKVLVKVSQY